MKILNDNLLTIKNYSKFIRTARGHPVVIIQCKIVLIVAKLRLTSYQFSSSYESVSIDYKVNSHYIDQIVQKR